jgi:type III restriction enzyme
MYLKDYQTQTLLALRDYLERARMDGPAAAYAAITGEPARKALLRGYAGDYRPLEALPDAPYVCLRIPTGGGKTLLAAHAIALARDAWIERDNPLVLWLTPSDMIRRQTLAALNNPRHAYRQALDEKFGGAVRVFDIADFTMMRPHDMRDKCCILVGTIQSLRVKNTEGRKVYADNEELEPHFARLKIDGFDLEPANERRPKYSLANLLHVHRPLMIVDEAHNAVTQLSREMQKRVNPCAIVEFTATPRFNSNILYSVSAWELKDAEMIKLPIHLQEHRNGWRQTISAALATHALLAAKAAEDRRDYIRPIILFQAQPKDEEVTVEALKAHLIEVENVAPEKIAVATGDQRELDGVNLFDPACPVEFVITVEALREGWDCSFAYVLTSVSRIRSETSVEQLLGRVLRMPYAQSRAAPELNKAYAHVSEPTFADAARALKDCLTNMGFDEEEATSAIESDQFEWEDGLFAPRAAPPPALLYEPPPAAVAALRQIAGDRLSVETQADGRAVLRVSGWVTPELEADIAAVLPNEARAGFCEAAASYRAEAALRFAPAQKGESFVAPALVVEMQGELRLAEHETFMEYFEWSLNEVSAILGPNEFTPRESSDAFELDVKRGGVSYTALGDEERMILAPQVPGWDKANLVMSLDRQLRDIYFMQSEMQGFIHRALDHLTIQRGLTIPAIWMDRFRLVHALRTRIEEGRADARKRAYQLYLFEPGAIVRASPEHGFSFHEGLFAGRRFQARVRGLEFKKHFLGPDRIPAESGPLNGEEAECALALESFDEVAFWVRNVPLREDSFWLPLASARFYPDFVAKLKDGRVFLVEYKGKKYATTDDSREKRTAGALWERHGGGLFLMVEKMKHGLDMKGQIAAKLRG